MFECSVCSIVSFLFNCIYTLFMYAVEHPMVLFFLSFLIALVFVVNIHTAKLICDFSSPTNPPGSTTSIDYGPERGPHTWQCSAENQSPINIIDCDVQKLPIRELLTWNHYDDLPSCVMLENTGHTVVLRARYNGNTPTVSGADLLASYTFVELCFRWSQLNSEGSEHMLNDKKFPLELQAMHRTGPAAEPTSCYDLLMIAYFYELSANNPFLEPIVQNLYRIQKPGSRVEIPPFPLVYLCYQFRTGFYSYGGSLTEPPCYQGAEWFIFPEPLAVSERQLNEFRMLLSSDGKSRIQRNARPVQNLNVSRVVNLNQYNPLAAAVREQDQSDEECFGVNNALDIDDDDDCE